MIEKHINLNIATMEELAELPGVGPGVAQCIIDARNEKGVFCNTSGMISIAGVTQEAQDSLTRYTYASSTVVAAVSPAWTTSHGLLCRKFRAVYEDNQELVESLDAYRKEVAERHNPNYDDTVAAIDADTACNLYKDAVLHAIEKLKADPGIEYFDTWEIAENSPREYDKPVLVCRRFAMGKGAEFVVGHSINPTLTIIAEEIEMDPDSTWSWTPSHPVLATPSRPRAAAGTPDYNPEVYASGQPDHVNGLAGGYGENGADGYCPDDLPGHSACESPTVQIIALRLLSLSRFDLRGQDGARGGRGQDGGHGGDGSRGKDGEGKMVPTPVFFFPLIPFCKKRPGGGGLGGNGGDAGDGGRGGIGGDGGRLHVYSTPESFVSLLRNQPELVVLIEGGDRDAGGEPGIPGDVGRRGLPGSVPPECEFQERILDSLPGSPGVPGQPGTQDGSPGGLELIPISDLDFELILDLPRLERLEPTAAPPSATVELVGHNLQDATFVIFSTYSHGLPITQTPSGQYVFTVPDVAGGWAEVSLENGGHVAPDWTLDAVELDFMVTPRIDHIDGPDVGLRSVWLDEFTVRGAGFRPDSDRVRVEIAGDFYTGIIDPLRSSRNEFVFRLPQVDDQVDVPRGDWDTVVMGIYGYSSNAVPLLLHSCRSVPLRPMPLFEDLDTSDYPYRPFGFYFHNFSQGVPDWDLFLDTYGKSNIGKQVAVDILFNAVVMSTLGTLSPVGGRLGPILTMPGTVGYFYAIWHFFLNGTIGEGMCTGMSAQALLDHLVGVDCFGRNWNGADTTARRLITLGSSRMLSQEVLFDSLIAQCAQEAANIPQTYAEIHERMASGYTRDEAPILYFLPSGDISDDVGRFMGLLGSTHAVVPYMVVEDIETAVEIGGVSQICRVNRIYIYDSNRPFSPYDTGLTGLSSEDGNALRPHPSTWDSLPDCLTHPVTPCRQTPSHSNLDDYVSVWYDSSAGDWRFFYDANMNSDMGFTLGTSPLRHFNGEQYLNLPVESWFGLLQQALELLLSPATLKGVYRWDPEAEDGLGERWQGTMSSSPMLRPPSQAHEIHFVRRDRPSVRVLCGTQNGATYSYRRFDPQLDVSLIDIPTAAGEEDFLYINPKERILELRTQRTIDKRINVLLQRWTGEEADYLMLRDLPLSAKQPIRLEVDAAWTSLRVESTANGRRLSCTLIRLTKDGAAKEHKENLVIKDGIASYSFDSWESVCDNNLNLIPDQEQEIWALRDRIDLSDRSSRTTSRAKHNYRWQQSPPKGNTMLFDDGPMTIDSAKAAVNLREAFLGGVSLHLPVDVLWAESFRIGNLIPRKPLKIMRRMSNRGNFQQTRVLVNGQPVSRSDWTVTVPQDQNSRYGGAYAASKDEPKSPRFRKSYDSMRTEFVVPASYITAPELDIQLEVVDSDFPPSPLSYEFFQEPILRVFEVFHEEAGLEAMVELDNGLILSMGALLSMARDQQVAIKGIKTARRPEELSIRWDRSLRGTDLRVEQVERDDSGRPQRYLLSDGSHYSSKEFISQLAMGAIRVRNVFLTGTPDNPGIELIGESKPKSFEHEVKALFAKGRPKKHLDKS